MITCSTPWRVLLLVVLCAVTPRAFSQNATFTPIGPATALSIEARDLSSNGKVVIGDVRLDDGLTHPFIWTYGVFTLLEDSGLEGYATGITADGATVAVTLFNAATSRYVPYRWTTAGARAAPAVSW